MIFPINYIVNAWNKIIGKKEIPNFPIPCGFIQMSAEAIERGLRDNQNKIIIVHSYNKFGILDKEIYPYSEERLYAIETIRKIPIIDKTETAESFPIYSKTSPQEVSYSVYE